MKVLWLTNIPSPYRVEFFKELGKRCELTVLFERKTSTERDESWKKFNIENFKAVFLKGVRTAIDAAFCPMVIAYLRREYDHIVVTNFSSLTGVLAVLYMKLCHIPYEIEGDGAFAGTGKGIKELVKKFIISGAKVYFSTSDEHDKYYLTYGAQKEQIIRYPFTSLCETDVLNEPISYEQKIAIRKKLGIEGKTVTLAVGRIVFCKGYDVLIHACEALKDISCYIVGGTPTSELEKLVLSKGIKNVHFVPFQEKEQLSEYYKAADVFVHPTREDVWGLVVNEAMAKGLPVVTTERCNAGLELIRSNTYGRIVKVDDYIQLREAIEQTINTISSESSEEILEYIRGYTIVEMVKKHFEVWIDLYERTK